MKHAGADNTFIISDVGMLKRQAAKMISSEHHIVQDGDKMSVNVIATGKCSIAACKCSIATGKCSIARSKCLNVI